MGKDKLDLKNMPQIYAIGEEGAFAVMATYMKMGAEMQGLSWDIIEDHVASMEYADDEGYHCILHYLGTPLVTFFVPNDEEGAIVIKLPENPGEKIPDGILS